MVTVVALSWLVVVYLMWRAFRTLPTPEELADARAVRPPLPVDFYVNLLTSAGEALFLIVVLWPTWARHYILRAIGALLALIVWFFATVPLDLNTMEWVHRRWLAFLVLLLLLVPFIHPFLRRRTDGATES